MAGSRASWEESVASLNAQRTGKKESSFEKSKRDVAENVARIKRGSLEANTKQAIKETLNSKPGFTPSKGGILRVDKALYDAGVY